VLEFEALFEGVFGSSGIVAPVAFFHLGRGFEIEIDQTFEGLGFEVDMCVVVDVEPEVDTLINGKTCDQSMLMIDVSAQGTNTIGRENMILILLHVRI
jgi:hypothetical protein